METTTTVGTVGSKTIAIVAFNAKKVAERRTEVQVNGVAVKTIAGTSQWDFCEASGFADGLLAGLRIAAE